MSRSAPSVVTDITVWSGGHWLPHRDVHLAGGFVTGLAEHNPGGSGARPDRMLDGRGGHLLPGFVNTHTHLQQSVMRGIGEGRPLLEWLRAVGGEMVSLTPERAYLAALAGALDGLRSGTTTLVEHGWPHPSPQVHEAVLRALHDTGMRAVLGRGVADRPDVTRRWGFDPRLMEPLEETLAQVDDLWRSAAGLVTVALAVPNPRSLTPAGLEVVAGFAADRDLTVSIHLLETTTDEQMCRAHTGRGAVELLDEAGFLSPRVLAVHCVELDERGRAVLAERGCGVSYNPVSNMRLGSGVAPVPELLELGVPVGLGVDGAASNDTQDMIETLRAGSYLQRAQRRRADVLDASTMLRMATTGANRVLGLPERTTGVAVGDPADLTLLRFDRDLGCLPVRDPGATLLTTGSRQVVDTVFVAGEVVLVDGHSTRIDERALVEALSGLTVPAGRPVPGSTVPPN
jgi:5-methylthioadenosine/S-adenosylhomocysteine deaminase